METIAISPSQSRSPVIENREGGKIKRLLSQCWPLVYFISVAALSVSSFVFFTRHYGAGEERDRAFFLSLIVASELSYWVSKVCRWPREGDAQGSPSLFSLERIGLLLAVFCGSSAFLVTSPDLKMGVACFLALSLAQFVFGQGRWRSLKEMIEVPAALAVAGCAFWLMVLSSYKDVHHWSFFLGPVYTVLDGGHLLWDAPSQYGFMNILSIVTLSRLTGQNPEIAMCHLLVLFEVVSLIVTFYFFRFRLGLSTLVSATVAATFQFCLPGWIETYSGPAYIPSSSAFRFLPSLVALLSFDRAVRSPTPIGVFLSAALIAIAALWSPESCVYTGAPLCAFLFFDFVRKPRLAFFTSRPVRVCLLVVILVAVFFGCYALTLPHGIDFYAFYEYAEAYATFSGTLPMEEDLWTLLFALLISTAYLIARLRFVGGGESAAQGYMAFVYVLCIATYFVARSNYRNVHNIIPWALTALALVYAGLHSRLRQIQRTFVLVLGALSLGFFIAYYPQGQNSSKINDRSKGSRIYVPLEFDQLPPGIAQAARETVGSPLFTVLHDRALFAQAPELGSGGHALPISPLPHFAVLRPARLRVYAERMIERVPRSYVLCQDRVCPGVPYVFENMKDIMEVKTFPFPQGKTWGWEILEITKR